MDKGWITLNRKLLDNPIASKPEYLALWVTLLLRANHKDTKTIFNNKEITIKKGSFVTGRKTLSRQTGIKETTLERILNFYETSAKIGQQKTSKNRIITILKWENYQNVDNKWTTNGQQMDTNNNVNNVTNNIYKGSEKEIEELEVLILKNEINKQAWEEFALDRKKRGKTLTVKAAKLNLKVLYENKNDQLEIIKNSIKSSWQALYPLKKQSFSNTSQNDKVRAYEKRVEKEEEDKQKEESFNNNNRMRELLEQTKSLSNTMTLKN